MKNYLLLFRLFSFVMLVLISILVYTEIDTPISRSVFVFWRNTRKEANI